MPRPTFGIVLCGIVIALAMGAEALVRPRTAGMDPRPPEVQDTTKKSRPAADSTGRTASACDARDYRGVARILARIKPSEAATIASHLSDEEAEGILRSLPARSAADLLNALPKERAASLSRRLLMPMSPARCGS